MASKQYIWYPCCPSVLRSATQQVRLATQLAEGNEGRGSELAALLHQVGRVVGQLVRVGRV